MSESVDRPAFSLSDAAEQCQREVDGQWSKVSRKTLRRARERGEFPNAYKADESTKAPWMIPVTDLIAAGFTPGAGRTFSDAPDATPVGTQPNTPIGPQGSNGETSLMDETSVELEELRSKLAKAESERAELLRRAEVAEAVAEERGKNLDDVRTAMKMLEAGQTSEPVLDLSEDVTPTEASTAVAPARRKFFARFNR